MDGMIAASSYNIAVELCLEAHDLSIFSHYLLPRAPSSGLPAKSLPGPIALQLGSVWPTAVRHSFACVCSQ